MKKEIELIKNEVKQGIGVNDAITKLDELDFTITETMKFLVSEYKISLGEAKTVVSEHPAWSELVTQTESAHNEIVVALSKSQKK